MALSGGPLDLGTPEQVWAPLISALPARDSDPGAHHVFVLAPHPDDEILGCGGAMQRWRAHAALEIWNITDGERSHGLQADPAAFVALRREEAVRAASQLELGHYERRWQQHPDGQADERVLHDALVRAIDAGCLLVAPLPSDGHPDHDAVGRAAQRAARERGARVLYYAVWAWHAQRPGDRELPLDRAFRLPLTALERSRKAHATACFRSQLTPRGNAEAVLPARMLAHFNRSDEVFFEL